MCRAHTNKPFFEEEFSAPQKETFVTMILVGGDYSPALPLALACFLAVVGCGHFLEVLQF